MVDGLPLGSDDVLNIMGSIGDNLTTVEIARKLDITNHRASTILHCLLERGFVERHGRCFEITFDGIVQSQAIKAKRERAAKTRQAIKESFKIRKGR